ncbi:hypothetical protein GF324_07680 [bacterium]|nr:hypothetical protein [bacterium]
MKKHVIIDTNVPVVANGKSDMPDLCVLACIRFLRNLNSGYIIVSDIQDFIFNEYRNHLNFKGQPGPGDKFFKWHFNTRFTPGKGEAVDLGVTSEEELCETIIPQEICDSGFDKSDRKFTAVSLKHPQSPPIAEATDVKWKLYENMLNKHGIQVNFICPDYVNEQIDRRHT